MRKCALARPARPSSFWAETTQYWAITIFFLISDSSKTRQVLRPVLGATGVSHNSCVWAGPQEAWCCFCLLHKCLLCFLGNSREQREGSQRWLCGMEGTVETVWLSFALSVTVVTNWYNLEELKLKNDWNHFALSSSCDAIVLGPLLVSKTAFHWRHRQRDLLRKDGMKAQLELLENVLGLCLLKTLRCLESLFLAHLYCRGTNDHLGSCFHPTPFCSH